MITTTEKHGEIRRLLENGGIASPEAEARIILEECCDARFFSLAGRAMTAGETERADAIVARRLRGEPLQYILGNAPFRDLMLRVTPEVLIPRPETELLAGYFIDKLPRNAKLLDLGTGSGAVALAAAQERPDLSVTGVDLSEEALGVARKNAAMLGLETRVRFLHSDLFSALTGEVFDGIAANLPYVSEAEYAALDGEVRDHEPRLALISDDDGLGHILRAARETGEHLAPEGTALFEMSPHQTGRAAAALRELQFRTEILDDLAGRARFVAARR
ncbi:MAG: peptide chain release factor N(5)-glutamine methyltransferase [Victivallaceae bacterium]|nr:peptide chain release factor N(5)-glutamine methyltransferase [Victivallaceae bacterium]